VTTWLAGYGMLVPYFIGSALAQPLLAAPSALASRISRNAGFAAWLITLVLLLLAMLGCVNSIKPNALVSRVDVWEQCIQLFLIVAIPQALAYPLARGRPLLQIGIAFGAGVVLAVAWIVAGSLSGAAVD